MSRLRIAIIGCGGFNQRHANYLAGLNDQVELCAFVDRKPEFADQLAKRLCASEAKVFASHEEMYRQVKPDAVVVGIPPYAHTSEITLAAQYGVHVFTEKPLALTLEKADEMVAAAEKSRIVTQVGFMYRFGAVPRRLKVLLAGGQAGRPGIMSARYACNSLHSEWWRDQSKSGGQVFEQAIHLIDLMRFLLGDAATVYSLQNNLFHQDIPGYSVEDVSGTVFGFRSGAIGVLNATNGAIPNRWEYDFRFVAQSLTVDASDANHARLTYTATPNLSVEEVSAETDVYAAEMDEFLLAIRSGAPTTTPLREGAQTLRMVVAAMRSAQTHHEEEI